MYNRYITSKNILLLFTHSKSYIESIVNPLMLNTWIRKTGCHFQQCQKPIYRGFSKTSKDLVSLVELDYGVRKIIPLNLSILSQKMTEKEMSKWIQTELPIRLAHRLRDFHRLPFLAMQNDDIEEVYSLYLNSFEQLVNYKESTTSNTDFRQVLSNLLQSHSNVLKLLQSGFSQITRVHHIYPEKEKKNGKANIFTLHCYRPSFNAFLNNLVITRIGNRVLAEHYLSLFDGKRDGGVVDASVCVGKVIKRVYSDLQNISYRVYGICPPIQIIGEESLTFSFITEHLYFMIQELLKNAICAVCKQEDQSPIIVEIMKGRTDIVIRISDKGGGIPLENLNHIWEYGFTTNEDNLSSCRSDDLYFTHENSSPSSEMCGYGFGLPLVKIYAQYFGGSITLTSIDGVGTDVYLHLNYLGNAFEMNTVGVTADHRHLVVESLELSRKI